MTEMPTPTQIRDLMPFAVLTGIELLETTPELVRGRLEFSPELCTTGAIMHGGALMSLADTCAAVCAFLNLPEGAVATTTIESKTNFMRALRDGALHASAQPLHAGRTTIVLETTLTRDDGALAGKVTQTQAFQYPRTA